jgi:hypothetical protein
MCVCEREREREEEEVAHVENCKPYNAVHTCEEGHTTATGQSHM